MPTEIEMLRACERFGAWAVFGRPLGVGEVRNMTAAQYIVDAYRAREASKDWAGWASSNPQANRLLDAAAAYHEQDMV